MFEKYEVLRVSGKKWGCGMVERYGEQVEMGSVLIHENVIAWCKGLVKP